MNLLPRHPCLFAFAQTRHFFQTAAVRLLCLGVLLTSGTLRASAQTITGFTTEVTFVNGIRHYLGHVTLSNLLPTYVPASKGVPAHWAFSPIPVTLSNSNPTVAQAPASVIVGTDSLTASFPITTTPVSTDTVVSITATYNRSRRTANLVVPAPLLSSLTLRPPILTSYSHSAVIIALDSPAPPTGTTVTLSKLDTLVFGLPDTVTIPAGSVTVAIPFSVGKVIARTGARISATLRGATLSADLDLVLFLPFDFNSDGRNDLILQNRETGEVGAWYLDGARVLGGGFFHSQLGPEWNVVGAGNNVHSIYGSLFPTLVFQNATNGRTVFVYFNGANVAVGGETSLVPKAGYKVVGMGDFAGDGFLDLVFQNQNTHEIVLWLMNGSFVTGGVTIPTVPAAGWNVVGVGDFNRDGRPDLLFQNALTGQLMVWYLSDTRVFGTAVLSAVPPAGWQVKAIADYNNDGMPDIVFMNATTRQAQIWFMNGLTVTESDLLSLPVSAPYQIVGPH